MLAIKLRPIGKKKQISYRVVVGEKRSKLVGKFTEDIGWYNPHTNKFSLNNDRVKYWIASGALPTPSVHNILITAKLIEGTKIPLHGKSKQPQPEAAPVAPTAAAAQPEPQASPEPEPQEAPSEVTE